MRRPWKPGAFTLAAVATILAFDTIASLVSLVTGWRYSLASIGSLAVYTGVGFLAGRRFGVKWAVGVTITVAAAESTVGWAISWAIGPGRQPSVLVHPGVALGIVLTVVLAGGLFGFFAGVLGVWVREGSARDTGAE